MMFYDDLWEYWGVNRYEKDLRLGSLDRNVKAFLAQIFPMDMLNIDFAFIGCDDNFWTFLTPFLVEGWMDSETSGTCFKFRFTGCEFILQKFT